MPGVVFAQSLLDEGDCQPVGYEPTPFDKSLHLQSEFGFGLQCIPKHVARRNRRYAEMFP